MPEPKPAPAASPAALDLLLSQVINPGWCVACGACLGLCPHLIFLDGQVAAPDPCGLGQGRCLDLCPQSPQPDPDQKRTDLLQALGRPWSEPMGPVTEVWWGRATTDDLTGRVQYGGVVSTLVALALETGLAEEAVLTRADQRGAPQGIRVRDRAGVLDCAGSIYAAGGSLGALNQALAEPAGHPLLAVGLPCQSLALAAMRAHPAYPAASRVALSIGLFCTLTLGARDLRALLARAGVSGPVLRADFPPPPAGVLQVTTGQGLSEIPLEQVYPAMLPGCRLCPDLTAEMADIAVGAAEGHPGLNTILVRGPAGQELLELARQRGLIELREPEPDSLEHLEQAARNKRARAQTAWQEVDRG